MLKFIIFLFIIADKTLGIENSIRWVNFSSNIGSTLGKLEPVGYDIGSISDSYICRAYHNGHYTLGKMSISIGKNYFSCIIPYNSEEIEFIVGQDSNVEALLAPRGWTNWVPVRAGVIPSRIIYSGSHPDGEPSFICRVLSGGLIPGKGRGTECRYPRDGEQVWNELEALTMTQFGDDMIYLTDSSFKGNMERVFI